MCAISYSFCTVAYVIQQCVHFVCTTIKCRSENLYHVLVEGPPNASNFCRNSRRDKNLYTSWWRLTFKWYCNIYRKYEPADSTPSIPLKKFPTQMIFLLPMNIAESSGLGNPGGFAVTRDRDNKLIKGENLSKTQTLITVLPWPQPSETKTDIECFQHTEKRYRRFLQRHFKTPFSTKLLLRYISL